MKPTQGTIDGIVRGDWSAGIAGDRVCIEGKLRAIEPPRNPGQFDFEEYYRGKRQRAVLFVEAPTKIQWIGRPRYSLAALRTRLRNHFDHQLSQFLPPSDAAIASAMLLGKRHRLDAAQQARFVETGTAHLLAISGLHVGILASAGFWLLRLGWLPRSWSLTLVVIQVSAYAWLVEFNPPVTRASILIILFCLSRMLGQRGLSFNVLALAGLIVLAINPSDLFNTGPQLSFLAVAALVAFSNTRVNPVQRTSVARLWFNSRGKVWRSIYGAWRGFVRSCGTSAALWLVTTPLIALRFHLVSWGGLLANPIAIPLTSGVLYGGLAVMLIGDFCPMLARGAATICRTSLWLIDLTLYSIQQFWWSSQWVIGPPIWSTAVFMVGFWALLACPRVYWDLKALARWIAARSGSRWNQRDCAADRPADHRATSVRRSPANQTSPPAPGVVIAALLLLWWITAWILPNQWLWWTQRCQCNFSEVTFIDVGHGTSVLIRTPGGKLILYDAGSFGSVETATQAISGVLWSKGIMHLDAIVLSHADLDHYNAVPSLLERFSVGRVLMTPLNYQQSHRGVVYLREQLQRYRIPVSLVSSGDQWPIDARSFAQVLSPPAAGTGGDDNANSIVLRLQLAGRCVLLPGDLDGAGLQAILATLPPSVDLAMAPHHGSLSSKPAKFVDWCRPQWIAISGDRRRLSATSVRLYSSQGCQVASTASYGALSFQLFPDEIVCRGWIADPVGSEGNQAANHRDSPKSRRQSYTRDERPKPR